MTEIRKLLSGDRPKHDPNTEDLLGWKDFCRKFADDLSTGSEHGSSIYALYGSWGSGKSTAKNFTVYYLKKEHNIDPIEFEPWSWSGRDKVIDALFFRKSAKEWDVEILQKLLNILEKLN